MELNGVKSTNLGFECCFQASAMRVRACRKAFVFVAVAVVYVQRDAEQLFRFNQFVRSVEGLE